MIQYYIPFTTLLVIFIHSAVTLHITCDKDDGVVLWPSQRQSTASGPLPQIKSERTLGAPRNVLRYFAQGWRDD